jgi:hypothetical protein
MWYKRPQIASSRCVNAVESQHDRRGIAMIAVQTPTDFFFHKKHCVLDGDLAAFLEIVRTPWERG